MRILLLSSLFLLFSFTESQLNEEFEACIAEGKSVKACKARKRNLIRAEKNLQDQKEKQKKVEEKKKQILQKMDEAYNSKKYIVFNPETGEAIDLRKFGYLERTRVRCLTSGGTWEKGECKGRLSNVQQIKDKVEKKGYLKSLMASAEQDPIVWEKLNSTLDFKEQRRKIRSQRRKWIKQVGMQYQMSKYEVETYLYQNPGADPFAEQLYMLEQYQQGLLAGPQGPAAGGGQYPPGQGYQDLPPEGEPSLPEGSYQGPEAGQPGMAPEQYPQGDYGPEGELPPQDYAPEGQYPEGQYPEEQYPQGDYGPEGELPPEQGYAVPEGGDYVPEGQYQEGELPPQEGYAVPMDQGGQGYPEQQYQQ